MALTAAQFRKKGHGKTAPWVDLVNSEEWDTYGRRTDWMDDPSWLPFFLRQWRFAEPRRKPFPAEQFRDLRAALRQACRALFAGRHIPETAVRSINGALNVPGKHELSRGQDGLRVGFVPASGGWDWILAQIALLFVLALTHGEAPRVKICENPDCCWVFYDSTKARTRRWCSDKVCGNRDRVRRARARAAR